MEFLQTTALILIIIVCVLFISSKWKSAVIKRDVEDSLKLGAGSILNEKKKSAFWYLFK